MQTREIRPIDLKEVSVLRQLAIQTFEETFGHDNSPEDLQEFFDKDYTEEALTKNIENPDSKLYFLLLDQEPVGYLQLNTGEAQTESELEDAIEIQRIYVLKAFQGKGLGKFLFDFAMEEAAASGKKWAWLGVWEHNYKAQALYQKFGFEKFSEHQFQVGDKIDTDWLMRKALK